MLDILMLISALSLPVQEKSLEPTTINVPMKCIPREIALDIIKKDGLFPIFVGIISKDIAIETWITKSDTERWVSFITKNDGNSCIVGSGRGYGFTDKEAEFQTQKYQLESHQLPKLDL